MAQILVGKQSKFKRINDDFQSKKGRIPGDRVTGNRLFPSLGGSKNLESPRARKLKRSMKTQDLVVSILTP